MKKMLMFLALILITSKLQANMPHFSEFKETSVVVLLPEPFGETKITIKLDEPNGSFVYASIESNLGFRDVYPKDVKNYDKDKLKIEKITRVFLNELQVLYYNYDAKMPLSSFSVCMRHGFGKNLTRYRKDSTYFPVLVLAYGIDNMSIYSLPMPTEETEYNEKNGCELLSNYGN